MPTDDHCGLDGRHRHTNGDICRKNGHTEIGALRHTYGEDFASGSRSDLKLIPVLDHSGFDSPSAYLGSGKPCVN